MEGTHVEILFFVVGGGESADRTRNSYIHLYMRPFNTRRNSSVHLVGRVGVDCGRPY